MFLNRLCVFAVVAGVFKYVLMIASALISFTFFFFFLVLLNIPLSISRNLIFSVSLG